MLYIDDYQANKDENIKINNFNIYYANARSIRNKMNFLDFLFSLNNTTLYD